MATTAKDVLEALKQVKYPGFSRDIVSFGIVRDIEVGGFGTTITIAPPADSPDLVDQIGEQIAQIVATLPGTGELTIVTAPPPQQKPPAQAPNTRGAQGIPGVKAIIAVASGKGGVGKSTVAANLALALAEQGKVGLLDADVYGPSIPMMVGVQKRPQMTPEKKIIPVMAHGMATMSMGYLSDEKTPVIWRGPMVSGLIQQFLGVVDWGELDYLIIDLPPGTGDIQLTLCQQAPLAGAVIVTTPQDVSLLDARKGLKMFEQVNVPVLGVIENMSFFVCGHCQQRTDIFRHGGGQEEAVRLSVPFLGEIPLDPEVVRGGDAGQPIVLRNPQSPVTAAYRKVAGAMAAQLSIANAQAPAQANVKLTWNSGAASGGPAAPAPAHG